MGQKKGNNDVGFKKWKGLVTEQNIGQYEAEAAVDADNVEFLKDGTVQRRLGFEQEAGGVVYDTLTAAARKGWAFSTHLWENINGIAGIAMRAIQLGSTIKLVDDIYPVSSATVFATINLDDFATGAVAAVETEACQYASGAGVLIIVASGIEPIKVTVSNKEWPPIPVVQQQEVMIRWDRLEGAIDENQIGPVDITHAQEFDLRNTGWPWQADCSADKDGDSATVIKTDPASYFKAKIGRWPKPAILYSALRLGNAIEPAPLGSFSPWEVDKLHFGNTIPPKAHYITPAWSFDSRALMEAELGDLCVPKDSGTSVRTANAIVDRERPNEVFSVAGVGYILRIKWVTGNNVTGQWLPVTNIGRGTYLLSPPMEYEMTSFDKFEYVTDPNKTF